MTQLEITSFRNYWKRNLIKQVKYRSRSDMGLEGKPSHGAFTVVLSPEGRDRMGLDSARLLKPKTWSRSGYTPEPAVSSGGPDPARLIGHPRISDSAQPE